MSDQQPVAGVERDPLKDLYTDWSEILATTPDLTMRLFRASSTSGTSPPRNRRT